MEDNRQYPSEVMPAPEAPEAAVKSKGFPWVRFALVCVLLGIILSGAGWLSGSHGGGISFVDGRPRIVLNAAQNETRTISLEAFSNVQISASSANIRIIPGRQTELRMRNLPHAEVYVANDTLIINARQANMANTSFNIGFLGPAGHRSREIRLYVEAAALNEVNLATSSGEVRIEGDRNLHVRYLNVTSSSGNQRLQNIFAHVLNARTSSGNQRGKNVHITQGAIHATSGNITLDNVSWHNLETGATSGNIRIREARPFLDEGETSLSSTSGNIQLEIEGRADDFSYNSLFSRSGNVRINGNRPNERQIHQGRHTISMNATSGNIRLDFDR